MAQIKLVRHDELQPWLQSMLLLASMYSQANCDDRSWLTYGSNRGQHEWRTDISIYIVLLLLFIGWYGCLDGEDLLLPLRFGCGCCCCCCFLDGSVVVVVVLVVVLTSRRWLWIPWRTLNPFHLLAFLFTLFFLNPCNLRLEVWEDLRLGSLFNTFYDCP